VQFEDIDAIIQEIFKQELVFPVTSLKHTKSHCHTCSGKGYIPRCLTKIVQKCLVKMCCHLEEGPSLPIGAEVLKDIANMKCIVPSVSPMELKNPATEMIVSLAEA